MSADLWRAIEEIRGTLARLRTVDRTVYATGTWTPVLSGDGATPGTFTYHSATGGEYTRAGRHITFTLRVRITAITVAPTAGSNMYITLPSALTPISPTSGIAGGGAPVFPGGFNLPAGYTNIAGYINSGSPRLYLSRYGSGSAAANVVAPEVALVGGVIDLAFIGHYDIA